MHEEKVTQSNHYSTVNKQDNSDLIITDVREDDAGIYICQINTEPLRNKIFRLFVHRPPWNLTSNLNRRRFEAKLGAQVGLTCSAKGNPKPKITWKRGDKKRLRIIDKRNPFKQVYHKHGETLKLYNVRREDAGEIMCIANNGILPIISRQFKLIVTYMPKVELDVRLGNVHSSTEDHGDPGKPVFIVKCLIDASPIATYDLSIEGISVPTTGTEDRRGRTIVRYVTADRSYFGKQVKCSATNKLGNAIEYAKIPDSFPPGLNGAIQESSEEGYYDSTNQQGGKEEGYYDPTHNVNGCSSSECRTKVTIEQENLGDEYSRRESETNHFWGQRSPEYQTNLYDKTKGMGDSIEDGNSRIDYPNYPTFDSSGTPSTCVVYQGKYAASLLCYIFVLNKLLKLF